MSRKKLKIKKRRHLQPLDTNQLFKKREALSLFRMDYTIRQAFPDPGERQRYIQALIKGLEGENMRE